MTVMNDSFESDERKRKEIIECLLVPDERMGHTEGDP